MVNVNRTIIKWETDLTTGEEEETEAATEEVSRIEVTTIGTTNTCLSSRETKVSMETTGK